MDTPARTYERETWPVLARLVTETPDAGIHFQSEHLPSHGGRLSICLCSPETVTYRRAKDQGTPTGEWMADLVSEKPWFKDLLPDV